MRKDDKFVERHILIGLITSTEYLHEIRDVWDSRFIQSNLAKRVSTWCLEYYDKYGVAPNSDIEGIYFQKLKKGSLPEDLATEIEQDILPSLSDEYERQDKFNVAYLLDRTRSYFTERNLELHQEEIEGLIDEGDTERAEQLANTYAPIRKELESDINLSDPESITRVGEAFQQASKPIMTYPGALGDLLNPHLIRGGFVAFMGPEKRGKSYILMDMARRGVKQRLNVMLFQAGDMSEAQQLRRLGIHLTKKSDLERYIGKMYEPVKDCIHNQADTCQLDIREHYTGLEGDDAPTSPEQAREGLTIEQLKNLKEHNPDYKPCHNCSKFHNMPWGCSWVEEAHVKNTLKKEEAMKTFKDYFVDNKRTFTISTHPNNTLSVAKMDGILEKEYRRGVVYDLILVDYAELLTDETAEYRHRQDAIWKDLRSLSEKRHALLATATQADARSYQQGLLDMSNFSEDKRKFSHVTAMFGLNQDPEGREKDLGIMRINTLTAREGDYNPKKVVHVLQNLKRGQPIMTSYW